MFMYEIKIRKVALISHWQKRSNKLDVHDHSEQEERTSGLFSGVSYAKYSIFKSPRTEQSVKGVEIQTIAGKKQNKFEEKMILIGAKRKESDGPKYNSVRPQPSTTSNN